MNISWIPSRIERTRPAIDCVSNGTNVNKTYESRRTFDSSVVKNVRLKVFHVTFAGSRNCIIHNPQNLALLHIHWSSQRPTSFLLGELYGDFSHKVLRKISWNKLNGIHAWWSRFEYYLSVYCSCKFHLSPKCGSPQCYALIMPS